MAETFYVYQRAVDVRPLEDGLFAIFNDETTDNRRYFELVNLRLSPVAPTSSNGVASGRSGALALFRTTASSGGDAFSAIKHNTASASLPSQVTCTTNPDSVTTTGVALKRIADAPTYFTALGGSSLSSRAFGGGFASWRHDNFATLGEFGASTNCEAIILREGQGVAVTQSEYGTPHSMIVAMTVTNVSTGATYTFRSSDVATNALINGPLVSLFNATGSGVVLAVRTTFIPLDGETNPSQSATTFPQNLRLARIQGLDTAAGAATLFSADSSVSAPAALRAVVGTFRSRLEGSWQWDWPYTHGATISVAQQQNAGVFRRNPAMKVFGAIGQSLNGIQLDGLADIDLFAAEPGSGIIVRPGEGVGLLAGTAGLLNGSTFVAYNIEATILHYPPAGSGTFPPVGDVDQGVLYGPNGNDFTGTLEQPAVADVKLGIQYGAGGTEFTGTYSGGGGNTYSKSRVVNKG